MRRRTHHQAGRTENSTDLLGLSLQWTPSWTPYKNDSVQLCATRSRAFEKIDSHWDFYALETSIPSPIPLCRHLAPHHTPTNQNQNQTNQPTIKDKTKQIKTKQTTIPNSTNPTKTTPSPPKIIRVPSHPCLPTTGRSGREFSFLDAPVVGRYCWIEYIIIYNKHGRGELSKGISDVIYIGYARHKAIMRIGILFR